MMKPREKKKQIVIVGGGSAGIMVANRLRKQIRPEDAAITLIEKRTKHFYQPGFLTLLFGIDKEEDLSRDLRDLLVKGITLVTDEARKINLQGTVATARSGEIPFDYVIIATGAKLALEEPEGLKEGLKDGKTVFSFYTFDHAQKLREALKRFEGGTIVSCICEMPVKCAAAPVGFILLAEAEMRRRGIRDKCRFLLTTPASSVPPSIEPYASHVERLLHDRDIEVRIEFNPSKINTKKGFCEDFLGERIDFDLLCIIPPHAGEEIIQNSEGLADPVGWVTCNKNTLRHRDFDNIYAVGDAGSFPSGKTASAARKQAAILARRIKSHIAGEEPTAMYDGNTVCPILTGFGTLFFAEFDYGRSISTIKESRFNWFLHVSLLRRLYWNFILKGRFFS
jgi:sulfide:quinone oxidoreductase